MTEHENQQPENLFKRFLKKARSQKTSSNIYDFNGISPEGKLNLTPIDEAEPIREAEATTNIITPKAAPEDNQMRDGVETLEPGPINPEDVLAMAVRQLHLGRDAIRIFPSPPPLSQVPMNTAGVFLEEQPIEDGVSRSLMAVIHSETNVFDFQTIAMTPTDTEPSPEAPQQRTPEGVLQPTTLPQAAP
jgi:hypothetical protein